MDGAPPVGDGAVATPTDSTNDRSEAAADRDAPKACAEDAPVDAAQLDALLGLSGPGPGATAPAGPGSATEAAVTSSLVVQLPSAMTSLAMLAAPLAQQGLSPGSPSGKGTARIDAGRGDGGGLGANEAKATALQAALDAAQASSGDAAKLVDAGLLLGAGTDIALGAAARAAIEPQSAGGALQDALASGTGSGSAASPSAIDALAAQGGIAARHATNARPAAIALASPVGSPPWRDEVAARVSWMIDNGEQRASLTLSPENLGPLEVRIAVREGEASVWFGASQPETRAALELAMPRLREMLASSGLSLTNSGVFSDSPRDPYRALASAGLARASLESGRDEPKAVTSSLRVSRGVLDLYA
jgi:flagellar hook-length control protein FliK